MGEEIMIWNISIISYHRCEKARLVKWRKSNKNYLRHKNSIKTVSNRTRDTDITMYVTKRIAKAACSGYWKNKKKENYLWHCNNTPPLSKIQQKQQLKQVDLVFFHDSQFMNQFYFNLLPGSFGSFFFQCMFSIKLDLDSDRSTSYNTFFRTNYWQFYIRLPVGIVWKLKQPPLKEKVTLTLIQTSK